MPWSVLQKLIGHIARPLGRVIAWYASALAIFTILRLLRFSDIWLIDLANTFAPYWYMPLGLTLPISIMLTRQGRRDSAARLRKPKRRLIVTGSRGRRSALLQIVLIVIGLYWFALPTLHQPVAPPQGDTFTVVTFNVQGHNRELEAATDWLLAAEADVIVLQETAEGYDHRLARLYDVYAHEDHVEGSVRIFSRYAILEREILTIEDEPGRLALRLALDAKGRELAVYAAHFVLPQRFANAYGVLPDIGINYVFRYDEGRRNAQIRRVLEILETETRPFLLVGDFNMSDASLIYDEIAGQLGDAWRGAGSGAGRTWPVAEAVGWPRVIQPLLRIDYVWHSEGLRAAEAAVGEAIGSDHLPLKVVMEWR